MFWGNKRKGFVDVSANAEVVGGAVAEDELIAPRWVVGEADAAVPDAAREFPP